MINSACLPFVNAHNVMRLNGHTTFALTVVITREEKSWKWWKFNLGPYCVTNFVFHTDVAGK